MLYLHSSSPCLLPAFQAHCAYWKVRAVFPSAGKRPKWSKSKLITYAKQQKAAPFMIVMRHALR